MIGRTNAGGWLANAFAVIAATYPEGSTCTCTNGTKTLKAKDTSGSYLFVIPESGTWTVTATDGTHQSRKSVSISALYQSETIKLSYFDGLLFDAGNQNEAFTGGWWQNPNYVVYNSYRNTGSTLIDNTGLRMTAQNGTASILSTRNSVDLTDFKTLNVTLSLNSDGAMISFSKTDGVESFPTTIGYLDMKGTGTKSMDISSINGTLFIAFFTNNDRSAIATKVWLE